MIVGLSNVKDAKTQSDYRSALGHFLKASRLAPLLPQPYEASGHIFETLQDYGSAAEYFRLYLLAAPRIPNAQEIRDHIYVLEDKAKSSKAGE
jgi:regulator of sirC expression with transglutaminase-like and TPR domain